MKQRKSCLCFKFNIRMYLASPDTWGDRPPLTQKAPYATHSLIYGLEYRLEAVIKVVNTVFYD